MEYFDNTLPILQFFEHKINLNQVYQFTAICRADPPNIFVLFHYKRKLHFFYFGTRRLFCGRLEGHFK